jgi:hypothetical protein
MQAKDSVAALIGIAQNDPSATVRAAATHSLGMLHDVSARSALEGLQSGDSDGFVRDAARIALRRL